ncbi:MAG TPA: CRISPR-associated endoribonuclease Cas6 [Candidatus Hydrothermia bacterium]|nr:CRISPR-associated endoribonuclease Cas6 [Candidatus Hydrothermia bacterium]MDD5573191.1 CRISPR-associated endoribonuclease Cas6 [Candidatus Hydrothermia bacterium]HOK23765.1 CRISPR-associated endoribonuclease Cas6 [Candidatus Hydrothermia bacterium]HOL24471.1 CRISPR-associated endoribonuclease Cas6 [Candidatus Hydrothermia bacterium]HPO79472.1 CRISPR-associated endoribonuclease Cas6 [Candidatus Hydrothermia bacterium]
MRLGIVFKSENKVILPLSYNEIVQGFIYGNLSPTVAEHLHEEGFKDGKRSFRLFTFSRLLGNFTIQNDSFQIKSPFKLIISSPHRDTLQNLAENLLKSPEAELGNQKVTIESISAHFTPPLEGEAEIEMLSPVTVYSTLTRADGGKKTYYYNPKEEEFSVLIRENIIKKYKALYEKDPGGTEFHIEPLKVLKKDEKIITYKGFVIKGWMGTYKISGTPELLKIAYEAGIGAKNSQGFGCFEVIK